MRKERPLVVSQETTFNRNVLKRMGHILEWFTPSPWAPWGSSQTVFVQPNPAARHPYSRREVVRTADGVDLHLDWKESPSLPDNAPVVLVLHGIAGCSDSKVAKSTTDLSLERGWRSVVYVRRGHGDSSLLPAAAQLVAADDVHVTMPGKPMPQPAEAALSPDESKQLLVCKGFPMHCDMDDMAAVVGHVHKSFPDAPKLLVGFSAGANVVVKYLGLHPESPFVAAVSVCNGHELVPLTMEFLKRPVANTLMAQALQSLLQRRAAEVRRMCDARGIPLNLEELLATNNVREFEETLMLPLYRQFSSVDDYYEHNSCHTALKDVSIPLLSMAARDDPLIHPDLAEHAISASRVNPNVISVTTNTGGHLGWLTGWGGRWWQQDVVFSFLDGALAEHAAAR